MELGSVTLKRIGFFCFPIKHSTHTVSLRGAPLTESVFDGFRDTLLIFEFDPDRIPKHITFKFTGIPWGSTGLSRKDRRSP